MAITTIIKLTNDETSADMTNKVIGSGPRSTASKMAAYLESAAIGARTCTIQHSVAEASGVAASGTLTISSGNGAVGGSINGVSITVVWATSDTASATALATAINASGNALVSGIVTAAAVAGVVTITAVEKTKTGNAITLVASGTGVTASGARLTGGVTPVFTSVALGR